MSECINTFSGRPPLFIITWNCWVWIGPKGDEHPLEAIIPAPLGGSKIFLSYPEGSPDGPGIDAIAHRYARSARVHAEKRRYIQFQTVETVDGRAPSSGFTNIPWP
jgi:hypothetical protein